MVMLGRHGMKRAHVWYSNAHLEWACVFGNNAFLYSSLNLALVGLFSVRFISYGESML